MLRIIVGILVLLYGVEVVAAKFVVPPKRIVKIAQQLEYSDFPDYLTILAIARVESAYHADAYNPEKGVPSVGVMQVRNGSKNIDTNMGVGVSLLRQYYKQLGSAEAAIRSYNIGPKNYKANKLKISADDYYNKYMQRRAELVKYFTEQKP